jgi:8-oxo-dGTP diphosphatase
MKKLQIAVGIIRNPQGEIFITQRAADAHMANKLEFPGGKIESDETPEQALIRELQEEVGITVTTSSLFDKLEYQFPDRHITLWFFLVESWQGEPWGKEGQPGWRDQRWIRRRFLRRMNRLSANLSPRAEPRGARLTRQAPG